MDSGRDHRSEKSKAFGTGPYPKDGWRWWDVCDLLKRLPDIAVAEYRESGSPAMESSCWYTELIEFLNETFPADDGVWMNFERPLASRRVVQSDGFLSVLLDFEVIGFRGQWCEGGHPSLRPARQLARPTGCLIRAGVGIFQSSVEMASPPSTRGRVQRPLFSDWLVGLSRLHRPKTISDTPKTSHAPA
jgi:hypothetical protein